MKRLYYCIKCINIQKVITKSGIIVYSCTLFPKRRGIDETTLACPCYSKGKKETLGDIEYLLIVLTHVKVQIDSLFVKAVGNYVKQ